MSIHFICRGNMFRSRLAEGYLRKHLPQAIISSSGIDASNGLNGHICWYAQCIADCHNFAQHLSSTWTKTTQEHLQDADVIITLDASITKDVLSRFTIPSHSNILSWNISDVEGVQHDYHHAPQLLQEAGENWNVLKTKLDAFIAFSLPLFVEEIQEGYTRHCQQ